MELTLVSIQLLIELFKISCKNIAAHRYVLSFTQHKSVIRSHGVSMDVDFVFICNGYTNAFSRYYLYWKTLIVRHIEYMFCIEQ